MRIRSALFAAALLALYAAGQGTAMAVIPRLAPPRRDRSTSS